MSIPSAQKWGLSLGDDDWVKAAAMGDRPRTRMAIKQRTCWRAMVHYCIADQYFRTWCVHLGLFSNCGGVEATVTG